MSSSEQFECVFGGDYENNDGSGGAHLLTDSEVDEYRESDLEWGVNRAGVVGGWDDYHPNVAVFCIVTRDEECDPFSLVFGNVVGGLEVVMAAARHRSITEVTVVDCGVVLWE